MHLPEPVPGVLVPAPGGVDHARSPSRRARHRVRGSAMRHVNHIHVQKDPEYGWFFECLLCSEVFLRDDQGSAINDALGHLQRMHQVVRRQDDFNVVRRQEDPLDDTPADIPPPTETTPTPPEFPPYRYPSDLPVGDVIRHYGSGCGVHGSTFRGWGNHPRPTWKQIERDYYGRDRSSW